MQSSCARAVLGLLVGLPLVLPSALRGQDRQVYVLRFDQLAVTESAREVFGGEYDIGRGIARLVAERLAREGIVVDTVAGDEAGTVEGTILLFGKAEASGEAGGVSISRLRVGIGRREEKAIVSLEARLVDKASGQLVTVASGQGESDRGGWNAFARLRSGPDLASMDLSGDAFRETAIGEATHAAVDQLALALVADVDRLGTFVLPEREPEPMPSDPVPSLPSGGMSPVGGGGLGWAPYQFVGTEHFRYDVRQGTEGEVETGYYQLDLQPAGEGRVRMNVDGRLGDESYSSSVTTGVGVEGMQMGYGQFMALGPVGLVLLNPTSWMMLPNQALQVGDGWSYGSGGESVSVRVERACGAGGRSGVLVVFRENEDVQLESCVAQDVPLPLTMRVGSEELTLTLTEYRR